MVLLGMALEEVNRRVHLGPYIGLVPHITYCLNLGEIYYVYSFRCQELRIFGDVRRIAIGHSYGSEF